MSLNMKSWTQALAKTAAVIEKTVQTTVQEVTGPKPLQEYDLQHQIGSAGPSYAWKLYSAKPFRPSGTSTQYPNVCVWVLDKRALSESRQRAGLSKSAEDSFLDFIRADAARLVRLRHPGIIHVIQGLDENKNSMAMVTEPLFSSLSNTLGHFSNLPNVPNDLARMKMGLLEIKHGMLQIAESLDFLHNNARLIHRSISPENVFITSSGAWKLGGFGFAISFEQTLGGEANVEAFHYTEYDSEDSVLPLQPSLDYTAPELVRSKASFSVSSDIFSFGCVAYHMIAGKKLFDCHNNVKMYMNNLTYLSSEAFSSIPLELVADLQRMLSTNESFRPTALEFTGSPFFRDDTRLRALRFLDHLLERDNMQKSEFLKALSDMWKNFDSRVLRYKVLPPLCAELRNKVMQPMILPMVLTIAESQDNNDFDMSTLPALVPVLSTAAGETLFLLVKHAELLINKTNQEQLISHVLPMLVRAYDDDDPRVQEEVLKKSVVLTKQLDVQLLKKTILPRVHGLALKTTVAAIRVNALLCLSELVPVLDKLAVLEILQTLQRCTSVDRSPPTLMCTLGVANSILKQYGIEFTAEHVLPLLAPLLTAQQLNVQQFAKYMLFVKDILRRIEEKRGVSVSDTGIPDTKQSQLDGLHLDALKKMTASVSSAPTSNSSWDEDWGPTTKVQGPFPGISSTPAASKSPLNFVASSQQANPPCSPVDIQWPPPQSTCSISEKQQISSSSLDALDPFSVWPPRSEMTDSGSNSKYGPTSSGDAPWVHSQLSTRNQGLNSPVFSKQNQGSLEKKMGDLGSIFGSNKNDQSAPRLAPPPHTAVGRGREGGRVNHPSHVRSSSEQPPLLDLL